VKEGLKLWLAPAVALVLIICIAYQTKTEARANSSAPAAVDAKASFEGKCAKCHGKDGRGKTIRGKLVHARDLTDAGWQNDVTDERLFNSISNGKRKMPDFKKSLSEEQIDALVAYVRHLKK